MTIVAPGASFVVNFITKDGVSILDGCTLVNKNTNVSVDLVKGTTVEYWDGPYYTQAIITATAVEGEFYEYTIYTDQNEIASKGTVFVTSQSSYSINNGVYVQNTTSNEYITR